MWDSVPSMRCGYWFLKRKRPPMFLFGRNTRPLCCSFPLTTTSNEGKGLKVKPTRMKSWTRGPTVARQEPNSRKSKTGVGRKKGRLFQRSCVLCDSKEKPGGSCFSTWRALRGELPRCSRDCRRAEKCSWKPRTPRRPRPAPRCLFFLKYLKEPIILN